ncbi:hypothetical protein GQ53DRAFT_430265 [Thozetella sp. PMI_491]|nr:hypothetical protein GQ53DRAFT_430265 [Thozetella sp. PMI_491]
MSNFPKLWGRLALLLLLAGTGTNAQSTTTTPTSASTSTSTGPVVSSTYTFEVGAVFPRANETYKSTEILPIAFSVHNFGDVRAGGVDFNFSWSIVSYSAEQSPGGILFASGKVPISSGASVHTIPGTSDTFTTLVDATNVTTWISRKNRGARFMLQWHIDWAWFGSGKCSEETSSVLGGVVFGVEAPEEESDASAPDHGKGIDVDVVKSAGGKCPVFAGQSEGGSIVSISPNVTEPTCPTVLDGANDSGSGRQADPCVVTIDAALASEIAQLATSTALARQPTTTATSTSKNAGWRAAPTQMAGVAVAAGLLACL